MSDQRAGDWMKTFTGRQFWPIDPQPQDIDIEDIAHALSMLWGACMQNRSFDFSDGTLGILSEALNEADRKRRFSNGTSKQETGTAAHA